MGHDILTDLGFNRADRRKMRRQMAKESKPFEFQPRPDLMKVPSRPEWLSGAWSSGLYWIQEKEEQRGWLRAMIGRHDKSRMTWPELQMIKNSVYGEQRWALQGFPPQKGAVDVANVYWLFVAPKGWIPEWEREL